MALRPFENGAERGGKDDEAFFAGHAAGTRRIQCGPIECDGVHARK
jgi:hypothetical protein